MYCISRVRIIVCKVNGFFFAPVKLLLDRLKTYFSLKSTWFVISYALQHLLYPSFESPDIFSKGTTLCAIYICSSRSLMWKKNTYVKLDCLCRALEHTSPNLT